MLGPTGDAITPGIETHESDTKVETEMITVAGLPSLRPDGGERPTETATGKAIDRRDTTVGAEATATVAAAVVDRTADRIMAMEAERL